MIKIKLTRNEYIELMQLYNIPTGWGYTDDMHRLLLHGHMLQLQSVIFKQLTNQGQIKFTLRLSPVEALAFYQAWQMIDTRMYPLGTVVVARCIKEIDQVVKNSRVYV